MTQIEVEGKRPKAQKIEVNVENIMTANNEFELALQDMTKATEAMVESSMKFCKKVSAEGLDVLGKISIVLENELAETPRWKLIKVTRLKREIINLRSTEKSLKEILNA